MGLFENLGRKVERFKQAAADAAEEEASHRCADCGEPYYTDQDACPECGGEVAAIQPDDGDSADSADGDASEDATTEATPGDEATTGESGAGGDG